MTLDFKDPAIFAAWFSVNDNVMGGVSQGGLTRTPDGTAVFSGVLSFRNNGGFSTIQADFRAPQDWSAADGIWLRVRGDGKRYGVYLRDSLQPLRYEATFETVRGEWMTVQLPFTAFYPTYFGQRVRAKALDPSRIQSMSVLIEYQQEGAFALELAALGTTPEQV
jgi:hypothetical protein